nr:hypothetical protein GCM10020063_051600 [Dactylosporangium thailandense]
MIALLPVYRPSFHLPQLLTALGNDAPAVVVDDGGGPGAAAVLDAARALGATVLHHPANRGKGAALRTGLAHIAEAWPGRGVVCADADGQHRAEDVRRVARHTEVTGRIALGVREFGAGVPLRSRIGNGLTAVLFRAATGRRVRDTQTGLRAYPAGHLPWLLGIPGDGFDYEMRVLLAAARAGHPIETVDVATTYLDDNAASHFSPLGDSARVYRPLLAGLFGADAREG